VLLPLRILRLTYLGARRLRSEFAERESGLERSFKQLRGAQDLIIMDLQVLSKKIKEIKDDGGRLNDVIKRVQDDISSLQRAKDETLEYIDEQVQGLTDEVYLPERKIRRSQ